MQLFGKYKVFFIIELLLVSSCFPGVITVLGDEPPGSSNNPPIATDDSDTVSEDSVDNQIDVLVNDWDPDGDYLVITDVSDPLHGSATLDASYVYYTPSINYNGFDEFNYTISDGNGGIDSATVFITITPVNDPPKAVEDNTSVPEDSIDVQIAVLDNDYDIDGDDLDITGVTQPLHGDATFTSNYVYYTPNPGYSGSDQFSYTISDNMGGLDSSNVLVSVIPQNVNTPPDAQADTFSIRLNTSDNTLDVLQNDIDPDGDPLTIYDVSNPEHGSASTDGAFIYYTPDIGYQGLDYFNYTVSDGQNGYDTTDVSIQVTEHLNNTPPRAVHDNVTVSQDSSDNTFDVLQNDIDPDGDPLTIYDVSNPEYGSASTDGAFIYYTPDPGYHGSDHFTYTISDGYDGYDTTGVTISVQRSSSPSSPPQKTSLIITTPTTVNEGEIFTITVTANNRPIEDAIVTFLDGSYLTMVDGTVRLLAPPVELDTQYEIQAYKNGYLSQTKVITVRNTDPNPEKQLMITAPLTVLENETFNIIVTVNNQPIQQAEVIFNHYTYYTDAYGKTTLIAPSVYADTSYTITVSKETYHTNSVLLLVTDSNDHTFFGRIFGIVTDEINNTLSTAVICLKLSDQENICTYTNNQGYYNLYIPAGNHELSIGKEGYTTLLKEITFLPYETIENNVILQTNNESTMVTGDINEQLIEEKITSEIQKSKVGIRVNLNDSKHLISYYNTDLSFILNRTDKLISCIISGEENTPGTILVFYLGEGALPDLDAINITYDNESIPEITDIEFFFSIPHNTTPAWLRVKTSKGLYILISIPHFSTHTITINSLIQTMSNEFPVILFYIGIVSVTGIVMLSRLFMHPVYQNYFRKKRNKTKGKRKKETEI